MKFKDNHHHKSREVKEQYNSIKVQKNHESLPEDLKELLDENLITLQKVHAILLNCANLTSKQRFEFATSERFFMKLYLKKLRDKLK
ncbi:MAG: hypothetical protein ACXAEX_01505 [Promethearchaeota archaeon]